MAESLEKILKSDLGKSGRVVPVDDKKGWAVWKLRVKLRPMIAVAEFRKQADGWSSFNQMMWDQRVMKAASTAITEIDAGKPPPPIANPALAALRIDEWTTYQGHWIVPIGDKRILVVYPHIYDGTPSVMLREYKKPGWRIHGYLIIDRPSAVTIAKHVLEMKG